MRVGFVIPAYQAERTVGEVVERLADAWAPRGASDILVVDDGSSDSSAAAAERAGARVLRHARNLGKGAALRSGLRALGELGYRTAVSVDADGQHPASEALRLARHPSAEDTLVIGVRDLERAGAPRKNRFSNEFSNVFLSLFSGRRLHDTQCGLRRYPIAETLALGARSRGYAFESEVVLRAARRGLAIEEVPVRVVYPPESERVTHFHVVRDPTRIVLRVVLTAATVWKRG
jgi:glycosyltransferase involved in cell wall biosynthesis